MRRRAMVFAALLFCSPALAEERVVQPYEMARSLQMLQEDVARGNRATLAAQQSFLTLMTAKFLAADAALWKDPKNIGASIVHALSGGDPRVLKTLIDKGLLPEPDLPLAKGTLAYAEGRNKEAAELLGPIDARTLLPSVGGYVALTQAALAMEKDPKRARRMLDTARLLMPGSLVEEGALRREISSAAKDGDMEKFEHLARNELQRFSASVYGNAFRNQFADAVVELDYGGSLNRLPMIAKILEPLDPAIRREVYLAIARRALVGGKTALVQFAATEAAREPAGQQNARAMLYASAAALLTEEFDAAQRQLKAVRRDDLANEDREILDRALALAARMRAWPELPPPSGPVNGSPHLPDKPPEGQSDTATAAVRRASDAIARTDAFLNAQNR